MIKAAIGLDATLRRDLPPQLIFACQNKIRTIT